MLRGFLCCLLVESTSGCIEEYVQYCGFVNDTTVLVRPYNDELVAVNINIENYREEIHLTRFRWRSESVQLLDTLSQSQTGEIILVNESLVLEFNGKAYPLGTAGCESLHDRFIGLIKKVTAKRNLLGWSFNLEGNEANLFSVYRGKQPACSRLQLLNDSPSELTVNLKPSIWLSLTLVESYFGNLSDTPHLVEEVLSVFPPPRSVRSLVSSRFVLY